jgi:hypothetical protein
LEEGGITRVALRTVVKGRLAILTFWLPVLIKVEFGKREFAMTLRL